ncbi:hypothetical protein SAMN05421690_10155 [Nitrosomonas sp. Nm51]|nr:hypothetical protein SAMN05421690_10155 [Nitrosomonas sp. Nm51]
MLNFVARGGVFEVNIRFQIRMNAKIVAVYPGKRIAGTLIIGIEPQLARQHGGTVDRVLVRDRAGTACRVKTIQRAVNIKYTVVRAFQYKGIQRRLSLNHDLHSKLATQSGNDGKTF